MDVIVVRYGAKHVIKKYNDMIIAKYKITFHDYNDIVQIKNLISHEDYTNIVKVKQKEIYEAEVEDKKLLARKIKAELKVAFSDTFFTDNSPLYNASVNGGFLILPSSQGGTTRCTVTILN